MTDRQLAGSGRLRACIGALAGVLLIVGAVTTAQEPQGRGRWRGDAAPNPLGQPLVDPTGHVKDDAMIRVPLAAADAKYADLDGKHMKSIVRELAVISDKNRDSGEAFWGRNVGTQGHVDTENWVEQYFR